jgi:hypothetical protein
MGNKKISNINNLLKRAISRVKIEEVYFKKKNYDKAINYLSNQKLILFENIIKIFKSNIYDDFPIGYILLSNQNRVVGFVGTIFSKRISFKKTYLFCNLHSWVVDNKFRLYSFFPFIELRKKKVNITAFTPINTLKGLLTKFGLIKKYFFYKVVFNFTLFKKENDKFIIENNEEIILNSINSEEKVYLNSCKSEIFKKILIKNKNNNDYIFLIGTFELKKNFRVFNLLYISNERAFKKNWQIFKNILSKNLKVFLFSEYQFHENNSFFPKAIFFSKIYLKSYYVKSEVMLSNLEIVNSDLLIL